MWRLLEKYLQKYEGSATLQVQKQTVQVAARLTRFHRVVLQTLLRRAPHLPPPLWLLSGYRVCLPLLFYALLSFRCLFSIRLTLFLYTF